MNRLPKHVARFLGSKSFSTTSRIKMRLVQFTKGPTAGYKSIGVLKEDGSVVDLLSSNYKFPNNMVDFLAGGQDMMEAAKKCLSGASIPASDLKILSPITKCEKVICVGMNYKDHCAEQNMPVPEEPVIFSKFPSSIVGDGDAIVIPKESNSVDWEVELAVVIGKTGRRIKEAEAFEYVAGYTVAHDVSAREWQMQKNGKQWLLGKTFDTFCPLGPALVTKDEIPDPHNLALKCVVNGSEVQNSTTGQMVFGVDTCIAWISKFCTLRPGDVILTGTPPGVGVFRKPPVYLKAGDVAVCEIEKIGKITNPVVNEE